MIELRFGSESLSRLRFAISPLTETFRSLRALDDPGSQAIHLPWAIEARRAVADLDLRVLLALLRPHDAYTPDFFAPPPAGPLVDIDDELAAVQAVGAERVREELREAFGGRPLPDALIPLAERPERGLRELVELTRAYWDRTLAPHWPRLRALLTGDITYRARTLADGGAKALFSDIDPCVEWTGETLRLHKVWEESLDLDTAGCCSSPARSCGPASSCSSTRRGSLPSSTPPGASVHCGSPARGEAPIRSASSSADAAPLCWPRSTSPPRRPISPTPSKRPRPGYPSTSPCSATPGSSIPIALGGRFSTCARLSATPCSTRCPREAVNGRRPREPRFT